MKTMKVDERIKKGRPTELVYFQSAGTDTESEENIATIAVRKDDILSNNSFSVNMLTDDNAEYVKMLKERFCEISIPTNAQIFYHEGFDRDSEDNDLNAQMSAEDFVMQKIIKSTKEGLATADCTEVTTDGTVYFTIAFEHCNAKSERKIFPDETELRIFQVSINCEKQIITFRERIVSPEISGIGISDPCFVFMKSLKDDKNDLRCTLECENCTCNLTVPTAFYYKLLNGQL